MKTEIGKQYCVTCDSACDIVDTATGNTIHTHHAGEAQSYFTAIGLEVEASDDTAVVTEVFKSAPAGNGGGGYIESNLNVGHGAADAVAAVCTLTLGDLATGGTLADSNGKSVELENPHKYATGTVSIPDATAAGTLTIGEWSKAWEAQPRREANMILTPLESYDGTETPYRFSTTDASKTCEFEWTAPADSTVQDLKAAINGEDGIPHWTDGPPHVAASVDNDGNLVLTRNVQGTDGNGCRVTPSDNTPFELSEEVEFTNGQDARTAVDVFNDIHEDPDCPVGVSLDADEGGLSFTAKEYGVNDEIAITGSLFSDAVGMSGGHGDYSVAELVAAIESEFDDITPTAGETDGTITLTANEAGADANAITYTATGCFGGGTVKQGSTTRGKNAVEKTSWTASLNGEPLVTASGAEVISGSWTFTAAEVVFTGSVRASNKITVVNSTATVSVNASRYNNTSQIALNVVNDTGVSITRNGLRVGHQSLTDTMMDIQLLHKDEQYQYNRKVRFGVRNCNNEFAGNDGVSLVACDNDSNETGRIKLTAADFVKLRALLDNADALNALLN